MKKIQKMKKLFLMPLLLSTALFFVGCFGGDTDDPASPNETVDLYGTKWIGLNPGGHPVSIEFNCTQSTAETAGTYKTNENGMVYMVLSHDNTRQNYYYDYEYDDTTNTYKWIIRRDDTNAIVVKFNINDENTFTTEFFWHDREIVYKKIGIASTKTSFDDLDGTIWGGLNPAGRPMVYAFGKTRANHTYNHGMTSAQRASTPSNDPDRVLVTFAFDGTSTGYDLNPSYNSTTKKGNITLGGTNGIGAFTVSNDFSEIEFDNFYGFHGPGLKIYRIQ